MIKAAIFDWDGLLGDTEGLWTISDTNWLAQQGIIYKDELKSLLTGRSQADSAGIFKEHFKLPESIREIISKRLASLKDTYMKTSGNLLMPFVRELLAAASAKGLKLAIASGSAQEMLDMIVEKQGIREYFSFVVSTDKVKNGKPAPEVYLYVAELLQVKPNECIVFEDAENGVKSAAAAGMFCVAVPNKYTENQDFSKADKIVHSLAEIKIDELMGVRKQ